MLFRNIPVSQHYDLENKPTPIKQLSTQTLLLRSSDVVSGSNHDGIFNVPMLKLPTKCKLVIDSFNTIADSNIGWYDDNIIHCHWRGFQQPISYTSSGKSTSDILFTTKCGGNCMKYPPTNFASYATSNVVSGKSYGNGTYTSSQSTAWNNANYFGNCFEPTANIPWTSSNGYTSGNYTGSVSTTATDLKTGESQNLSGEWGQIAFPNLVKLTSYTMVAGGSVAKSYMSKTWYLLGSTDNNTWYIIDNQTKTSWTASENATYNIGYTLPFKYYRIVITSCVSGSYVIIDEVKLYGKTSEAKPFTSSCDTSLGIPIANPDMLGDKINIYFSSPTLSNIATTMPNWSLSFHVVEE